MTFARVTCVTLSKLNGRDNSYLRHANIFSFDVTQITSANVIHNLVEIFTPLSRFTPVISIAKYVNPRALLCK